MIDVRLMATIAIMLTIPTLFVRPWPADAATAGVMDTSAGALFVGVIFARLSAVAFDDPGSLTNLSDLLIIRSGMEFWPGLAAATMWLAMGARRADLSIAARLAALVPAALTAWACYEATCLIRDGCPGPPSVIGLHPDGLASRMFPVGLTVAIVAGASAFLLDRLHRRGVPNPQIVVGAVAAVAGIRSVASIWLPRIGDGLTRQHRESIVAFLISSAVLVMARFRSRSQRRTAVPS